MSGAGIFACSDELADLLRGWGPWLFFLACMLVLAIADRGRRS